MKNECSIIQDILPLYFENMVSEDTAAAVQEHLKNCPECAREFAAMKPDRKIDGISMEMRPGMEADALSAMRSLRRKFRKRLLRTTGIAVAALAVLTVLLHFFPIYRIAEIGPAGFYTAGESAKALYIGSPSDRAAAQAVLRMADEAFSDTRHTRVENEAAYGALAPAMPHPPTVTAVCPYPIMSIHWNCGQRIWMRTRAGSGSAIPRKHSSLTAALFVAVGGFPPFGGWRRTAAANGALSKSGSVHETSTVFPRFEERILLRRQNG